MTGETIVRVQVRTGNYSIIDNAFLASDDRLSWRAKGVLAYLLTRPDNWQVRITDIAQRGRDGRDAILSAMRELIACGYVRRARLRNEDGTLGPTEYVVYEAPNLADLPTNGKPVPGLPTMVNPLLLNTENTLIPEKANAQRAKARKVKTGEPITEYAERIFAAYPRRVGKPRAIKAISAALREYADKYECGVDAAYGRLLADAQELATHWSGHELEYCPHPSTYYNQRRYEDDTKTRPTSGKRAGGKRSERTTGEYDYQQWETDTTLTGDAGKPSAVTASDGGKAKFGGGFDDW
jgi:hypothetical protein